MSTETAEAPASPDDAEISLDELRRRRRSRSWWAVLIALAAGGAVFIVATRRRRGTQVAQRYLTERLARGDITEVVEATGTVQPVVQVQVGSQISGRVTQVRATFNQSVHRGDLLAEIDPGQYETALSQARAALASAQASLARARSDAALQDRMLQRITDLRARGLGTPADLDTAQHAATAAREQLRIEEANVQRASASVEAAQTNLRYTRIYSPIDGIVITRSVEPGQTVTAALAAPIFFVIANDLTHMRVIADVDEADVGNLRVGITASIHVDAFPTRHFEGSVTEVRFGPTTNQGVVTYPAVIEVDNSDLRLRPGMTALVSIRTAAHANVLRVPNAALRFHPGPRMPRAAGESAPEPGTGTVYVLRAGQPVAVPVHVGITNTVVTEVESPELREGLEVVLADIERTTADTNAANSRGRVF